MNKMEIDKTVLRETRYILIWTLLLSALMQAVFLIIGKWSYTVLLGNALTAAVSVLNFFLLGITVQRALEKEPKEAKSLMKLSQALRMLLLLIILSVGVALPVFDTWATVIPVFFTRIALLFRPKFGGMDDDVPAGREVADEPLENGGECEDGEQQAKE